MNLYDPSAKLSMANTAEELARRYKITREEADAFGYRSQVLAKKARDAGAFALETFPVEVTLGDRKLIPFHPDSVRAVGGSPHGLLRACEERPLGARASCPPCSG
jgi:acetyl-CoA acetyltransferase